MYPNKYCRILHTVSIRSIDKGFLDYISKMLQYTVHAVLYIYI